MYLPRFFIALTAFAFASCVPGMLSISSTPEGSEVVVASAGGNKRPIGKTPLDVPINDVFGPSDTSARLIVQKPGMYRESVVLAKSVLPANHKIHFNLKVLEKIEIEKVIGEECAKETKVACPSINEGDFTKLARGVANVQSLIAKKQYKNAEIQVSTMIADFPHVSVLHTLLGNTRYLSKDLRGAFTAYTRASELDPENPENIKMKEKLSKMVGSANKGEAQ